MGELKRDQLEWREGDMPFSTTFGDHFYCRSDGRAECGHVFLAGNGLPERWSGRSHFTIAELGFGTGLNFLETWRQWRERRMPGQTLEFVSFEAFPMDVEVMRRALSAWPVLSEAAETLFSRREMLAEETVRWEMDDQTGLTIVTGLAEETVPGWDGVSDAWFLDGFAPARNPAMWSAELMQAVHDHTRQGGTFATYTAAGWVRRNLQGAGFEVKKTAGFAGKRDMLSGVRL